MTLCFFHFLIIPPTVLTKLLAYFLVAHPSLVQVYNFVPDVLRQLLLSCPWWKCWNVIVWTGALCGGDIALEVRAVVWQSEGCRFDATLGVSKCP